MKRLGLVLLITLLASGCKGGGGSNESGTPSPQIPKPGPTPPPKQTLEWGELGCQKTASCRNEVLNQPLDRVVDFFVGAAPFSLNARSAEELMFSCGRRWSFAWDRTFANRGSGEADALAELLVRVLDPSTCRLKADLNQSLKTYFENTEEYKSEIK